MKFHEYTLTLYVFTKTFRIKSTFFDLCKKIKTCLVRRPILATKFVFSIKKKKNVIFCAMTLVTNRMIRIMHKHFSQSVSHFKPCLNV